VSSGSSFVGTSGASASASSVASGTSATAEKPNCDRPAGSTVRAQSLP